MNQKLFKIIQALKKIFSTSLVEKIIRLGLLLVMVIVGLTALAPEWLELKDDKIAQLKESVSQAQSNSNFSPPLINLNYEQLTVKINQFIGLIDKPENIGVPGAILLVFS